MIAEDLGRLFEIGFNVGILAYIQQNQLNHRFRDLYQCDLQALRFPQLHRRIVDRANVINDSDSKIIAKWSVFFLQKGFLSGLNFFREYLESTGWKQRKLEILYYQCNFCDDNSLGILVKGEEQVFRDILSQLGNIKVDIGRYKQQGEFLRADTLMLLHNGKQFRILSVDLSVFSIKSAEDIKDLDNVEVIRQLLLSEISYLRSKSVFSGLSIDTGTDTTKLGLTFSEGIARYFTAFKRKDKESVKLIQAASYAHSFYKFLRQHSLLQEADSVMFNVMGYTDRGVSAMSVNRENLDILNTCHRIYKQQQSGQAIAEARQQVLRIIKRKAAESFVDGKTFINSLLAVPPDTTTLVAHQERVTGFFNSSGEVPPQLMAQLGLSGSLDLRSAHTALIQTALTNDNPYVFLTGNPGIGKTTTIVEFLKQHLDDGFLFFYVSPRKNVNKDVIEKFKSQPGESLGGSIAAPLENHGLFCINTNADIIQANGGHCTVQYFSNLREGDFTEQAVHFIDGQALIERRPSASQRLQRKMEDLIQDAGEQTKGVLDSICEAIYTIIDRQLSNNIVATISLQSLKKTGNGQDTLRHFEKIFRNAYNQSEGSVIPDQMKKISQRIKHIFIMVDEITGDHSGVEFLNRISSILRQYELTNSQYGFNTKIIVADASIVDPDVIQQHLSTTVSEPDKIFYRRASENESPLSVQNFKFKGLGATVINSNSYPARSLNITYKVFIESFKYSNSAFLEKNNSLVNRVQAEIAEDINSFLDNPEAGQVIVYIQDKQRLKELTEYLKKHRRNFQLFTDYLEIHANISEQEKEEIQKCNTDVKVVFMTASASRGLSFPKAKHILVDIPRFAIEQNLMEIIQVIYRGRGNYLEDGMTKTLDNEEKDLILYLSERAVYYADDPELSLQESVLSLVNILLIFKTSVMTRISGSGQIGKDHFMMIPIGGKSVFAAGETFTSKISGLIKELKKEHIRRRSDKLLKEVYTSLEQLLGRVKIILSDLDNSPPTPTLSYLSMRESFADQFVKLVSSGLDQLLSFGPVEASHISGSMLVVSLANKALQENYEMRLERELKPYANNELLKKLYSINSNQAYPENLRSASFGAIELVNLLGKQMRRTQWFEQNSQRFDQYYAIPLFIFTSNEAIKDYFSRGVEEPDGESFRDILAEYIRCMFPVDNILPISSQYGEFPFVVFRSYSLSEIRHKLFTDKQLLTSNELNILNLILAQED
ncbi:Helicase-like protein (plasmid) [Trichormus variabilis ATCC 29413]|uniref:Helicase-like protein n=2 Tax=Anabaena variabilis TaxID=264691 RepID=Q3M122_TRIV2|nr:MULTISPECIES: helicase-related protein [Nostocaceae]ABA25321.1 Helicase-like protein [Trichormus variabilis ATCC 29413]MBC1213665.1 helicase [Trichormus variabilis ARAD]MBC1259543.1 helicase [Trichormus variabilis V5]MBC1271100.1 helicase [Trichormus variabilis FSR]MBC1305969.1 helicase [Trichormus variabilis N2B]